MWQIDGKHSEAWHPLGEERFIPLRDLSYGRHRLTVRVLSNESGATLDERELLITMKPPFYLSFAGILLERRKLPIAPLNDAGAPAGNSLTWMVTGVLFRSRDTWYICRPPKKGLAPRLS